MTFRRPLLLAFSALSVLAIELRAELLIGLSYSSPSQLEQIAAVAPQVRHATRQQVLVSGDKSTLAQLQALGFTPFLVDSSGPGEAYFLVPTSYLPDEPGVEPVYQDPKGWSLLRLRPGEVAYRLPYFLYPLPEHFEIRGWLAPRLQPKPAAPLETAAMEQLLAQVDPQRLERDVKNLALRDPTAPSRRDNLRTRFAVHPETFAATEYIRRQLAAVLGEEAVEVREFAVDPGRLSAHLRGQGGDLPSAPRGYNVVGVLPGEDPQKGYYIISAHYDATGVRTPDWNWQTDPAPGADDNATGVALVLESARILAGQRFPWSIRFIAFSGEELGLLGSRAYAALAESEADEILGVLNFDMIGYNHLVDRIEIAANPASRWIAELMVEASQRYSLGLRVDVLEDEGAIMSDHASFWARGYDAILAIENYLPFDSTYAVRQGLYRLNDQYHTIRDVPDSLNWQLVRKTTQLAVATLAQYAQERGLPNLAVHTGNLQLVGGGKLRLQVANLGRDPVASPFQIQVSRCGLDSTDCEKVYQEESALPLAPGDAREILFPWNLLGEMVFLLEVDPDNRIAETREDDNRAFQRLLVQPLDRIAVYPNPFRPGRDPHLAFSGLPLRARVWLHTLTGQEIWFGAEERQGTLSREIRWKGVNEEGFAVGNGIYLYTITTAEGQVIAQDKIAVVR